MASVHQPLADRLAQRKAACLYLWNLRKQFHRQLITVLSPSDLKQHNIVLASLSLEDGSVPQGRSFVQPCPKEAVDAVLRQCGDDIPLKSRHAEPVGNYRAGWANEITMERSLQDFGSGGPFDDLNYWDTRSPNANAFQRGLRFVQGRYDWRLTSVWAPWSNCVPRFPHMACIILEKDVPKDNELLRSEFVCATSLMASRFATFKLRNVPNPYLCHRFTPVLTFTYASDWFRLTQAYYDPDTNTLHFAMSKLIHLRHNDENWVKLLLRWYLCQPKRNTFYPDAPEAKMDFVD